jgi:iron complex outermembrane receptor protein
VYFRIAGYLVAIFVANNCQAFNADVDSVELKPIEVKESHLGGDYFGLDTHLDGDRLKDKKSQNLGALLDGELGVSATGYGAGASRPVMRGLSGSRVQVLENGLAVGDVSSISPDHAVANTMGQIEEVEILRGPAALAYGSGISGGVINVINHRISRKALNQLTGSAEVGYETGNDRKLVMASLASGANSIAWQLDANSDHAGNYRIPSYAELGGPTAGWAISPGVPVNVPYAHRLPQSYNRQDSIGLGVSYLRSSGYTGISLDHIQHDYGVPTSEGSQITQSQSRYSLEHLSKSPWQGVEALRVSLSGGDYAHDEKDTAGVVQTRWRSQSVGGKAELTFGNDGVVKGKTGIQLSTGELSAIEASSGQAAIVPKTQSNSQAVYLIGEAKANTLKLLWGTRYEYATQNPDKQAVYAGGNTSFNAGPYAHGNLSNRHFGLLAYSAVLDWKLSKEYGSSLGYTRSERAPNPVELYGFGPHDSTATFIVGNSNLSAETSDHYELKLYKHIGLMQGKTTIYLSRFHNYIYGFNTGNYAINSNYAVTTTSQAPARIKGAEAEVTYLFASTNLLTRVFGEVSKGEFESGGYLPLQPAPRMGLELQYQLAQLTTKLTYLHAYEQNRLASFELGKTPAYDLLNLNISYQEKVRGSVMTTYLRAGNLLNKDVRYSTTPETIRLYAPQMGRSIFLGIKASF